MKILIAEDRDEDRYLLEIILKSADHQVTAVADGQQAWDRCRSETFDLIISDILMPEMDGYMLCRRMRKNPELCHTPFIFLTATYMSHSDESFALDLGADDFIKKPADPDIILDIVRQYAGNKHGTEPPACTIQDETEFAEHHSRRILSVLKKKSDELERAVNQLEKTQAAVKTNEERYRLISASMSDYVYSCSLDENGRLAMDWISGAFERITGLDPEKIRFMDDWAARVIPEDRHWFEAAGGYCLSEKTREIEYRFASTADEIIWLKDSSSPVFNQHGKVIGLAGAVQDITKAKESKIRMRRLATAVESAAESIIITDTQGRIQYVNPAFENISGYSAAEVMGKNPRFLKSGQHGKHFYRQLWRTLEKGRVWKGNIVNRKKNGALYEIEAVISPIKTDNGEITNYIAVRRDVTREKALETQLRQTQKMEAIGTLAGGIAHDFNNILSAIIGFSELSLADETLGDDTRENLGEVMKAGNRARGLVQQILTFARQTEHEAKPVHWHAIVKEALKMLRASIPATIDIHQEITCKALVMGDASQLHQIIMNLCTNAAQAMPIGGELIVKLQEAAVDETYAARDGQLQPGSYVRLVVGDTGAGMTPSQMERIFDPFYTTKEKGEGTGLGLSVVHGIVTEHGGGINVYSEHGAGSTFNIFLPALERVEAAETREPAKALPRGDEHVLFLDDEPAIVTLTTRMLTILGYKVTACTSSREALERFTAAPDAFDIIISDMTMPHITGDELAQRVMAVRPAMPVILCSGFSKQMDSFDAQALGVRALLSKPLFKKDLAHAVRAALDEDPP